jgi:hypothetical protein
MSYCGALPNVDSESRILIDSCLASVRADARLDDEPVLPSLHTLTKERTRIVLDGARQVPSADAIVKSLWRVKTSSLPMPGDSSSVPIARSNVPTAPRSIVQRMRWPVFLCGFLAGVFGGVAVMKSPIGHSAPISRVVKATQHQLGTTLSSHSTSAK